METRIEYCKRAIKKNEIIRKKYWLKYFFMSEIGKYRFRCKLMGEVPCV